MSCRTALTLVRHAESECSHNGRALLCGWHDVPLSAAGLAQVEHLRRYLAGYPAAAVYSSPLKRALQTAEAARRDGLPQPRWLRSLSEIHCGAVEGFALAEVQTRYPDLWVRNFAQSDETFRWPGGEAYSGFRRRVLRVLHAIARRHPDADVLIFTHAGVISQLLGWMHGMSAARWASFRPANASITRVVIEARGWALETFDDQSHLCARDP